MFSQNHDLGASLYKTWSDKEKRDAGSRKRARNHLQALMTPAERKAAIEKESGSVQIIVRELLQ